MNAKHQFKYTYADTELEEFSPVEVTFDMPGDVTLTQMLWNFECYLKAAGFFFDGHLQFVEDGYEGPTEEDNGCCMSDTDCCGLEETSSSLDNAWTKAEKKLKEWNEGIAKLSSEQKMKAFKDACTMSDLHNEAIKKELKKNNWVHGICNPPTKDWKATN